MNQQGRIPGIVRNGVVVPQSNQPLPVVSASEMAEIRTELAKLVGS